MNLTEVQKAAVQADHPIITVLAGAGSGKTRTLIERIRRLIHDGTDPSQIVAISFTREAAAEIERRLGGVKLGFSGTFHSFILRLIQANADRLGYATARLIVLDEQAADELLMRCAEDVGCRSSLRKLKDEYTADTIRGASRGLPSEQLAIKRFVKVQRQNGLISYDGILSEGRRLLTSNFLVTMPKAEYFFVDEVQDCSDLDFAIYRELRYRMANHFYVGDPDQSIFAFRKGNVENLLKLTRDPDVQVLALEENYRSDILICRAAQRLIEHNINRVAKTLRPVSEVQGDVMVRSFKSPLLEQAAVIEQIQKVIEAIQNEPGTCAVLVRNRTGQPGTGCLVQDWTDALTSAGIPVASAQYSPRPKDWPLVKACIACLIDPSNDWSCYTMIRLKDGETVANGIQMAARAAGQSINAHTLHLPLDLAPTAYKPILARLGVSQESLSLFDDALAKLQPGEGGTELLALMAGEDHREQEIGQGVVVTTYHGAKGREFDFVAMPCFEDELIPDRARAEALEESRRLAYVAMTRAKHRLWISYVSERRPLFGGWKPEAVNPSRFIFEAGLLQPNFAD